MQGRASTGAFKGIWSHQASILTQEILWSSMFVQLKTTHGNARQSTLLFPSLHPMSKRNSVVIVFFSPLYDWYQNTNDLCIFQCWKLLDFQCGWRNYILGSQTYGTYAEEQADLGNVLFYAFESSTEQSRLGSQYCNTDRSE